MTVLANLSDMHCGKGWMYRPDLAQRGLELLARTDYDACIITGDITDWGLRFEFEMAVQLLEQIEGEIFAVPGNHDARHEGYKIFQELVGPRRNSKPLDDLLLIGLDSTSPDLDTGKIGREQRAWMGEQIRSSSRMPVVFLHHHVIPVPDTGRERNMLVDAPGFTGDLHLLDVPLVINGHKHVPWVWRLNDMVLATTGTLSCERTNYGQSFGIYRIEDGTISVERHHIPSGRVEELYRGVFGKPSGN